MNRSLYKLHDRRRRILRRARSGVDRVDVLVNLLCIVDFEIEKAGGEYPGSLHVLASILGEP